jgi:hypothetical protein
MDFILEHNEDPIPDATSSAQPQSEPINVDDEDDIAALGLQAGDASQAGSADAVEARVSRTYLTEADDFMSILTCQSIKCSQCGKTFKNTALANFHAEKSGHDQFEESTEDVRLSHIVGQTILLMTFLKIKPLTEEEKSQKLAGLRDKMAEKRALKAAEEAKEAKANELIRRKAGKVRLKLNPTHHQAIDRGSHISTGSRADQRRSKEQADSKRPRSKAPRFVSSLTYSESPTLRPCIHRNVTPRS